MVEERQLVLLVTGSIAAKTRTLPLVAALRKDGHEVTVMLTRAPEEWKWVSADEAKAASGHEVLTDAVPMPVKKEVLCSSQTILIAPASADFISRLTYASSELARVILEAQRGGGRIMLAPAMNTKMWGHPAVQRNCAMLNEKSIAILGPVKGHQACGDEGFGRMIGVKETAEGVQATLKRIPHPVLSFYETARQKEAKQNPLHPIEGSARILVALGGGNISWPAVEKLVADVNRTGMDADYVVDKPWVQQREALERLTRQKVVSDYFQIPELEGLEHIKLPERARCVFFPFLDDAAAMAMVRGEADTLFLAMYLASKAPVVTTEECFKGISKPFALRLRQDGFVVVDEIGQLTRLYASSSLADSTSRKERPCIQKN
jgi:phosphopantothenoylcysteine synthetase/decarboxylase